jgi:acetylornithine deacetylase/succinyl-diaminopimelate desuccinylase-like protein
MVIGVDGSNNQTNITNRSAIHQYIDDHIDEHTANIQTWIRQPSVSWDNMGVEACAELVASSYRGLGCREVEVIDGRFHPGVWAYYDAGAPLTIHNYCMFDTRTVQPDGWDYDPWGAELVPIDPYPKVLVGSGALGAKGPYVAWLNALAAIIAVEGTLPVNIMFLAEGEEIMGSPSYRDFVQKYAHHLQKVDASFCPSCSQSPAGTVSVGLGLKGMIVVELTASGKAWGRGPAATIHSAGGALVDSPPFRLAQALATLTNKDGTGCVVKGLEHVWSYRKPLDSEEQKLLDNLAKQMAGKDWRDTLPFLGGAKNVPHVVGGVAGNDPLINYLYGPTFNIAGLHSGFLGPETGTFPYIIPSHATASLDMRLVVEMSPEDVIDRLRQHLDAHGFSDIEMEVYAAFSHEQTSPTHPVVQAALMTLQQWKKEPIVWPLEAGGGPWTVVPNAFKVPCLRGATIGGGNFAPVNEFMVIEGDGKVAGLAEVEKYLVDLLFTYVSHLDKP